jgi:hypothetical protein
MAESPCCDTCRVYYTEGYSGPCQEFAPHATDQQIIAGDPPMCPGSVSVDAAVQIQRERAEQAERALEQAFAGHVHVDALSEALGDTSNDVDGYVQVAEIISAVHNARNAEVAGGA